MTDSRKVGDRIGALGRDLILARGIFWTVTTHPTPPVTPHPTPPVTPRAPASSHPPSGVRKTKRHSHLQISNATIIYLSISHHFLFEVVFLSLSLFKSALMRTRKVDYARFSL